MSRPFLPADRAMKALMRALTPHLGRHRLIASSSHDWASATFLGARHRFAIALEGGDALERAARVHTMLAETDIPIAGGFVADINVVARTEDDDPVLAIEALTIVEAPPFEPAPSRAVRRVD